MKKIYQNQSKKHRTPKGTWEVGLPVSGIAAIRVMPGGDELCQGRAHSACVLAFGRLWPHHLLRVLRVPWDVAVSLECSTGSAQLSPTHALVLRLDTISSGTKSWSFISLTAPLTHLSASGGTLSQPGSQSGVLVYKQGPCIGGTTTSSQDLTTQLMLWWGE